MKKTVVQIYCDLFLITSVFGYLWEVLLYLVLYRSLVNRGFFHGPWLPVYGAGAVLLELFLQRFSIFCPGRYPNRSESARHRHPKHTESAPHRHPRHGMVFSSSLLSSRLSRWISLFLVSACFCSGIEYLLGVYLTWRRGMRYWDYRAFPLNLNGYICLYSFLGFGIAGIVLHDLLFPYLEKHADKPQPYKTSFGACMLFRRILRLVLLLLFAFDVLYSCCFPNTGDNITFSVWRFFKIR